MSPNEKHPFADLENGRFYSIIGYFTNTDNDKNFSLVAIILLTMQSKESSIRVPENVCAMAEQHVPITTVH